MTWGEVPKGFVHGILQGYRVFHKRTGDKNDSYANSTTGPNERKFHITGFKKFTKYSVKVLAFTRKGDGAVSVNISVLTDEDGRLFKLSNIFSLKHDRPCLTTFPDTENIVQNTTRSRAVLTNVECLVMSDVGNECLIYLLDRK